MATIKTRIQKDGTPSRRVVWRQGGTRDGSWESETFRHKTEATRFRRDVDAAGQHWPEGWMKGVGTSVPARSPSPRFRFCLTHGPTCAT